MSGSRVTFRGDAMATVVQGVDHVRDILGAPPVIVGGLAVLSRLSTPHRATVDLDLVDRLRGEVPYLEVLRSSVGATPIDPAAVLLPTLHGGLKVDVLEVRPRELDAPSDDPGDRLHASSHAWAHDSATDLTLAVDSSEREAIEVTTPVAEPGPLVAMKLQAVMNRSRDKQGTDLLDVVRLMFDASARPLALAQVAEVDASVAVDIAAHVDLWFVRQRARTFSLVRTASEDLTLDDLDLVAELLLDAAARDGHAR